MEVVAIWNGRLAHALRTALRMTQEDFASYVGLDVRGVANWAAKPELVPTMTTQEILDTALTRASDEVKARFGLLVREFDAGQQLKTTAEAPAPSLPPPRPSPTIRRLTPETLAYLRRHLEDQYATDNLLGPRVMLPGVIEHLGTIERLRRNAGGAELDELLSLGARYAEFAGWLSHDAGDLENAAVWCGKAFEMAEAAGDDVMAAFAMMRRAAAAISSRDGAYAARLASKVQRFESPETVRIRAIAALTEATAHAISEDASSTDRALDLAAGLVEQSGPAEAGDPTAVRYCEIPLYESISKAKCHLELGRATEAIGSFSEVLDVLPADFHRDRGQYLARLSESYVLGEQPEAACSAAEESLAIALETGSSRTIGDLRRAVPAMVSRWAKVPEVIRFRDMLATVEHPNGGA